MLDATAIAHIQTVLHDAPHGHKRRLIAALAGQYAVSASTIYRVAGRGGARRRRPGRADYRDWITVLSALRHQVDPPLPMDLALEAAITGGSLPAEAADMPLGTAHRLEREMHLVAEPRRTQRIHADYPLQAIQFDGSTSKFITVAEPLSDGDWALKLHRKPTPLSGYKNKPLAAHRQRIIYYGLTDICTGYSQVSCRVARGESSTDAVTALVEMLTPLGVPDDLWIDQGPLFKTQATIDLINRLGIAIITGRAYQKERMGQVENRWKTLWRRFESSLFVDLSARQNGLTLSRLQARLTHYIERENSLRISRTDIIPGQSAPRAQAFTALMSRRPAERPLRHLPDNALATLYREDERVIDRSGIVRWENGEYECKDWHQRRVRVRQSLTAPDTLTLEDIKTGERSIARPIQRRAYGEVRGVPVSALDKLRDAPVPAGRDPYTERMAGPANVQALRPRRAAAAAIDNPLDADTYAGLDEALADFRRLWPWPLSHHDHQAVSEAIQAAGLTRPAVEALVADLMANVTTGGD